MAEIPFIKFVLCDVTYCEDTFCASMQKRWDRGDGHGSAMASYRNLAISWHFLPFFTHKKKNKQKKHYSHLVRALFCHALYI